MSRARRIAQAGIIAAVYGGLTLAVVMLGNVFAIGPIQLRISEAVTVVAFFTPAAIPGLTIGSVLANLYSVSAFGALGMLDVVFGSLGTLLGAMWMWRFRKNTALGLLGPVVAYALIVPAYLPIMLGALGVYKIPVLGIDLGGHWLPMYLFGVVTVGIGEAVVLYGLGLPLLAALRRLGLADLLGGTD